MSWYANQQLHARRAQSSEPVMKQNFRQTPRLFEDCGRYPLPYYNLEDISLFNPIY
ncbi:hypothetical protein M378DRAFT_154632 [Amanita muscaria Koide BX008]|uniref:Uncharacterized protein n=1 Tax=Amanita muscaria (strain Koide BX008) TaxID=946122 RepID=A0A0C2X9U8_AMAMK|nr:hypothetical protein M378DRAFT_154632 [Amanita muscaria Koide BX008]